MRQLASSSDTEPMDIEAVIAELGGRYTPERAAIVERMLREYAGTILDRQLIEEIGLALAIHRRQKDAP